MDSLRNLRDMLERSPLRFFRIGPDGRPLFANPAMLRMVGAESHEQLRRIDTDSSVRERATHRVEGRARWLRPDGSHVDVYETLQPIYDVGGRLLYYEGFAEDVTGQRREQAAHQRLELRYQRVVDHIRDALLMDDIDGNVVFANRAFLELFGLERSELDGLVLEDYVAPEWRQELRDRHDRRVRGEDVPRMFEYVGIRKDGTRMDIEVSVVEIVEDGRLVGTQSVIRDITDRKVLERRSAQARRMEALGQLAGGVAHDFNNILTALLHYPSLIAGELPPDSVGHAYLDEVRDAVERAVALTRQLLTFSRKQAIQPKPLYVGETLLALLPMLRRLLGETFELHYAPKGSVGPVLTDPSQLEQIVLNLVVNARDAMPSGGTITIALEVEQVDEPEADALELAPGRYAVIQVSDEGQGIAPDVLPRIYAPFFTTKPTGRGTGLGLATVLAAVQRASGHIAAQSELGQGTTFTVRLPITDRSPSPTTTTHAAEQRLPPATILLVEDSAVPRAVLQMMLGRLGQSVVTAHDGAEALAVLAERGSSIDAVVSDLVMPNVNGLELAQEIRRTRPGLPILLISGYAPGDLPAEVEEIDLPVLGKPFTLQALSEKLGAALRAGAGAGARSE